MPVVATDYPEAISHLPNGAVLRFDAVPWREYEQLLTELGPSYSVRIYYDEGRMEILAPTSTHEKAKNILNRLVIALCDELDIDIESLGSTTFRSRIKAKGAEPDDCFYVQHAAAALSMEDNFDLQRDPPPDIVVEVERASASLNKFLIYAALGVPEIWRLSQKDVRFYLLAGDTYVEGPTSRAFGFLHSKILSDFLALGLAKGGRTAARAFRAWVREHRAAG